MTTTSILLALLGFAIVASFTPGPNNVMVMASGANFGFTRTLPHILGVQLGAVSVLVLVGFGLAQIFELFPMSYVALKAAAVAYLLYLAWKIATAAAPTTGEADAAGRPLTLWQAALFQWVNPKLWTMAVTAVAVYAPPVAEGAAPSMNALWVAIVFGAVTPFALSAWTLLGRQLGRLLNRPSRLRAFNWTAAAILVASLYPILKSPPTA